MSTPLIEISQIEHLLRNYARPFLMKVVGAFILWFLAELLIKSLKRILIRALERKSVDPTLVVYAKHSLGLGLKALALILILGIFGVETTSFSAILAAAGVAIGVAWSGLLSNFAAGIFLILFRPFKLGDLIQAAGVTGVVREIGLFATSIDNGENLRHFVGNNKLFSDTILNYSRNESRIATFRIQLAHSVDPIEAIETLKPFLEGIDGANAAPMISGEITEFNPMGTVIQMKIPCQPAKYAALVSEGNRRISRALREKSFPIPEIRAVFPASAGRSES